MIPYIFQNNDALIKELKFTLKSVREWQNSKRYPGAGLLDKIRKSLNNSKYALSGLGNEYQQTFQIFLHWDSDVYI
jgi:hypothetical protein